MYRGEDQEEQTRHHEGRDQDRGIGTRESGAETIGRRGGMIHEGLRFGEKEPASGHESLRSNVVRAGESYIRRRQGGRVVARAMSGRESSG